MTSKYLTKYRKTENGREVIRRIQRKYDYGLSELQFQTMLMIQCGKCAVCTVILDSETKNTIPHIDHDHETRVNRGLVCNPCNIGMGLFKDDPELLHGAGDYLMV